MSSAVEEKKEPDQILDEDPIGDTDMNLQHLLRATNHLQIAQNEFEKAKKQLQAKGFNIPSELLKMGKQVSAPAGSTHQDPYGNSRPQQNLFGGHSTAKKNGGNTFSDQKTPNGHPNTFLYRAHINLDGLSSANQGEYQDQGYTQNVSSFYNDEVEEKKADSEQPLRIT